MAYDIPDEIQYREKIIANLDSKQLAYAILFGMLSMLSYRLPFEGEMQFVFPVVFAVLGVGFAFLKFDEIAGDIFSYFTGLRQAPHQSIAAQRFFEVKEVTDDAIYLDDGTLISLLEVQPINFAFIENNTKKAILTNYRAFLNQLSIPIQILVRTTRVSLDDYFTELDKNVQNKLLKEIYADFREYEDNFLDSAGIMERRFYLAVPQKKSGNKENDLKRLNEQVSILQERISACSLATKRLCNHELREFLLSYADIEEESTKTDLKEKDISKDDFRNVITPSFRIVRDHALINGEVHRIMKVNGYPREVENGWLQSFLSKNEMFDISIHIKPSSIKSMLVYLHNQIIQQTGDLLASTAKGTPNPSLEIKKSDTMRVYDALYKGKEKLFRVSIYLDAKTAMMENLNLLTEKCRSYLNSNMMVPGDVRWRMADGIKSTLPLTKDKLGAQREFLTDSLVATFPFISPVNTVKNGILFAHDTDTLNPIFIDLEKMSNKHFFVIGISGSGKSYTSKYLITQQMFKEETKIFILDPNGEYSTLCQKLDGQIIELSRDSGTVINIFDMQGEDFGGKMMSLISAFDIIVGGLTESQKGVLNRALILAYKKKGIIYNRQDTWNKKAPTFSDFRRALRELRKEYSEGKQHLLESSFEALLNRVDMYCEGGIFGFLDSPSKIDVKKKFICFDLSRLPKAVKNLMMFATLEYMNMEIKKDKKPKAVLIDEGWSLLRSKEAAEYILDFIKTSRKFNTSMGFITQEIEDLLKSNSGKSILNTASVKILMRQNPTNIDLICENLKLNEHVKNYLLTAASGCGVVVTEHNIQKFFVKTSEKLHELITTNPNEVSNKEVKKKKKFVKPELDSGLYVKNQLSDDQANYLLSNGYIRHKDRITQRGGSTMYLVKRRHNESPEHAFFCYVIHNMIKEKFGNAELQVTSPGDVIFESDGKKIAFEIETGKNIGSYNDEQMNEKFERLRKEFDMFYIVVTKWKQKSNYEQFGKVVTRENIKEVLEDLQGACINGDLTNEKCQN